MAKAHLTSTLAAGGLTPNTPYGLSVETRGASGSGINLGTNDQTSDATGHVIFNVNPALLAAVARTGNPCDVKIWVRHGGTLEDAAPVAPGYVVDLTVA